MAIRINRSNIGSRMGKSMRPPNPTHYKEYKENAARLRKLYFQKENTFKNDKPFYDEEIDKLIDRQISLFPTAK